MKKPTKKKASPTIPALDRDAKGRLITVGCIIRDDDVYGRVTHLFEGALIFRPFPGQGISAKQPALYAGHDEVEVVDNPAGAVTDYALQTLNLSKPCVAALVMASRVATLLVELDDAAQSCAGDQSDLLDKAADHLRDATSELWTLAEREGYLTPKASGNLGDACKEGADGIIITGPRGGRK